MHSAKYINELGKPLFAQGAMAHLVTDYMLAQFTIIARREDVGAKLCEKCRGLLDRIGLYLPFNPGEDDDWLRDAIAAVRAPTLSKLAVWLVPCDLRRARYARPRRVCDYSYLPTERT